LLNSSSFQALVSSSFVAILFSIDFAVFAIFIDFHTNLVDIHAVIIILTLFTRHDVDGGRGIRRLYLGNEEVGRRRG
jgi:hypothetical protein